MSSTIQENVKQIRERIAEAALRSGREPEEVRLVAVTKTVEPERVAEAVEAGVRVLGENYVRETQKKQEGVVGSAQWHLIGHLQSNKAKLAVRLFDVCETVDRPKIIRVLEEHATQEGKRMDVLIQVNLFGEVSKSGAPPDQVLSLVEKVAACEHLCCTGLMTIPPFFDEPERARAGFAALRRLRDEIQPVCPSSVDLRELSMGMSGDFEVAVEEGATLVRIGTAIFGSRQR
jgi:pyridoxal phosphate enzyme (YggS family)